MAGNQGNIVNDQIASWFLVSFKKIQSEMRAIAASKGFEDAEMNIGEVIALVHAELSEALEAARHGNPPSEHIPEYSGMEEEFADAIIRIMHISERKGLDVSGALLAKAKFNKTREHKHGGKLF